jgi:hypothetical protein
MCHLTIPAANVIIFILEAFKQPKLSNILFLEIEDLKDRFLKIELFIIISNFV